MSAANKAKGSRHEIESEFHANQSGLHARRLPRAGVNDIGDMAITLNDGEVIVCELKNTRAITLPEFLRQASVEADNYEAKYGTTTYPVAVVKARGKGPGKAFLVWEVDEFYAFLKARGLA